MENLYQQIITMRQSLFEEGILDNYFIQLESLQDNESPNFVEDVTILFFQDASKLFSTIEVEIIGKTPLDYTELERILHQLKGSSASIGANKVNIAVNQARDYCKEGNLDGVVASLEQIKREINTLQTKLDAYFQLLRQYRNY